MSASGADGGADSGATPYERIKELQQELREELGRKPSLTELLALTHSRDPFNAGSEADIEKARWFGDALGDTWGAHLRRVHYRLLARGDAVKPDGEPYENTKACWEYLNTASRLARYLGFVDPEAIIDRRNPAPQVFMGAPQVEDPEWSYDVETNGLDRIDAS